MDLLNGCAQPVKSLLWASHRVHVPGPALAPLGPRGDQTVPNLRARAKNATSENDKGEAE